MGKDKTIRSSKYEILRILTMIIIVLDHIPSSDNALTFNYYLSNLFMVGGKFGCNIFVLIGGFLLNKKFNFRRIVELVMQVFFYGIVGVILNVAITKRCNPIDIILTIKYWFPFAYIFMLLIMPFIDKINITLKQWIVKIGFVIFSFLTLYCCLKPDTFVAKLMDNGFAVGPIWFAWLYMMIGCFKQCFNRRTFFVNISWYFIAFLISYMIMYLGICGNIIFIRCLCSPVCLFSAGCLYVFFEGLPDFYRSSINKVSKCTFVVYLFHSNKLISDYLWSNIFRSEFLSEKSEIGFVMMSVLAVLGYFVVAYLMELLRNKIDEFRTIEIIKDHISNLGNRIYGINNEEYKS